MLFLSFRASLSPFTFSKPICLFHEPMIHHSYRLGLMVLPPVCQPFAAFIAGLSAFHLDPQKWPSIPPKWFTEVKIVVSHDYHFNVIAMIDSGADMNCIYEGLIPSKYFEKSTEKLVYANGTKMKIKYELNNAHVAMIMSISRFLLFLLKTWLIKWFLVCLS